MANNEKIGLEDAFDLKSFEDGKKKIEQTFDEILKYHTDLKNSIIANAKSVQNVTLMGEGSGAELKQLTAGINELRKARKQLSDEDAKILQLEKAKQEAIKTAGLVDRERLKTERENIKTQREQQKELQKTKKVIDESANSIEALNAKLKRLVTERKSSPIGSDDFKKLTKEINGTSDALKKADPNFKRISNIGNYFKDIVSGGLLLGGVAGAIQGIGAAISAAFTKIVDFQKGMTKVKALTGASASEMVKLKKATTDMAAETGAATMDIVGVQTQLAAAGLKANQILAAQSHIIDLATASGEDLTSTADIVSSTIQGLGLTFADTQMVTDVMTKALNDTSLTLGELGNTFKYTTAIAQTTKTPITDLAAMMEVLAQSGIKGEQAGTGLRTIFSKLFKDGEPLIKTLSKMNAEFAKYSDAEKLAKAEKMVGAEAKVQLLAIINNTQAMNDFAEANRKAEGATKNTADAMRTTLDTSINKVGGSWDRFLLQMENGEGIIGWTVNRVLKNFALLLDGMNEMTSGWSRLQSVKESDWSMSLLVGNLSESTEAVLKLDAFTNELFQTIKTAKVGSDEWGIATKQLNGYLQKMYGEEGLEMYNQVIATYGKELQGANKATDAFALAVKNATKEEIKKPIKIKTQAELDAEKLARENAKKEFEKSKPKTKKDMTFSEFLQKDFEESEKKRLEAEKKAKEEADKLKLKDFKDSQDIRNAESVKYLTWLEIQHNKELELLKQKGATEDEILRQQFENAKSIELEKQEVALMNISETIDMLKKTGGDASEIEQLSIGRETLTLTNQATKSSEFKATPKDTETVLGLNKEKLDIGLESFQTFADEYGRIMDEIVNKQLESAQREQEIRQGKIDSLQQDFDNENALQQTRIAEGKAADNKRLAEIQNQIENEKKLKEDADKKAEAARIKKAQLDKQLLIANQLITISNLIVSASEVTKGFTTIPIAGLPLAIAGVASLYTMFKAFSTNAKKGFKTGGYTGDGSVDSEAGVVHGQEFVVTAEKTKKAKGLLRMIHEGKITDRDMLGNIQLAGGISTAKMESLLKENILAVKDANKGRVTVIQRGNGKFTEVSGGVKTNSI